ncbi:unnamed protein product [Trichogramma brassicae]|uniref:Uncharacterized protein n=1 Tax=Trichogramma brassicae TaxID=86971 RepID=A0A6H5IWW0_9HYME|nr:unnamed protein product [Trichogramma brassicae]
MFDSCVATTHVKKALKRDYVLAVHQCLFRPDGRCCHGLRVQRSCNVYITPAPNVQLVRLWVAASERTAVRLWVDGGAD